MSFQVAVKSFLKIINTVFSEDQMLLVLLLNLKVVPWFCDFLSFVACIACKDCTLNVFSMGGGRRICPPIALDSFASVLRCSGVHVMVITSNGSVSVWWVFRNIRQEYYLL